jgi:hypothetical protein
MKEENINNVGKFLDVFEKVVQFFQKYKVWDVFKALIFSILIGYIIYFAINPDVLIKKIDDIRESIHSEDTQISFNNSNLINIELENLRLRTKASRALVLQFHNGKKSLGGLPFIYLTASNESLDYCVKPVAEQYEEVKTSLYPFVTYILQNEYWSGNIEDLREIDKSLAYRIEGNDVKHLAILDIASDKPLGLIFLTYTDYPNSEHDCKLIEHEIRKSALKIGLLMQDKK